MFTMGLFRLKQVSDGPQRVQQRRQPAKILIQLQAIDFGRDFPDRRIQFTKAFFSFSLCHALTSEKSGEAAPRPKENIE